MSGFKTASSWASAATMTAMLSACGMPHRPIPPEVTKVDTPAVGTVETREVGDTLVEQATKYTYEVLIPNQPMKFDPPTAAGYFTTEGDLVANIGQDGKKYYCATQVQVLDGGRRNVLGENCYNNYYLEKYWNMPVGTYKIDRVARVHPDNFQRQLIYTGKSGKNIYVSYREFKNDMARPAFTQDLTFDLSESRTIGMKGARIEVLEANNTNIRYRLLSTFAKP